MIQLTALFIPVRAAPFTPMTTEPIRAAKITGTAEITDTMVTAPAAAAGAVIMAVTAAGTADTATAGVGMAEAMAVIPAGAAEMAAAVAVETNSNKLKEPAGAHLRLAGSLTFHCLELKKRRASAEIPLRLSRVLFKNILSRYGFSGPGRLRISFGEMQYLALNTL